MVFMLLLSFSSMWAQTENIDETDKILSINDYLNAYIAHNIDLKTLQLDVEEAQAELDNVNVENGVNVTVSTGSSTVSVDDGDVNLDVSPSVTVTVPKANNTVITTSAPVTIAEDYTYFDEAGVSVSTDLIPSTTDNYQLNVEKYERALFEAQLAVDTKLISLKSDFWQALYDIYTADKTIKDDADDLYTDQIDFNTIKAQGYSEKSSKYRTAQLLVQEDSFTVEKDKRNLDTLLVEFAVDCGLNSDDLKGLPSIPADYYNIKLVVFNDYDKNKYIDLEGAIQDHMYQTKVRAADSDFSLTADAGYDYTGYSNSDDNETDDDEGNAISTGLTATYGGLSTSLGISTLLEDPTEPSLTFSFSYDFGTHKTDIIDDREADIDRRTELLTIESAKESWEEAKLDADTNKATYEWTRKQNAEQLALYKDMYEDSQVWYDQGIIAETDLLQAKNSYETKIDDSILTVIDCIMYNLGVEQLFIGEN
jgi:hypothetical protein